MKRSLITIPALLLLLLAGCSANDPIQEDLYTEGTIYAGGAEIRGDGTIKPVHLANADAPSDSIYYSTDNNTLVYKDTAGAVNILY